MSATTTSGVLATRLGALSNGYTPVPIPHGEKGPKLKGWQRVAVDGATVRQWELERPCDTNTGLRCGTVIGVDLDVLDAGLATKLEMAALVDLGMDAPRRTGRAPKTLLLFRAASPGWTKLVSRLFTLNGQKAQVEILATGQQFVAFGTHPDTQRPYVWADGRTPANTPLADLPTITREQARKFIATAEQMIEKAGGIAKAGTGTSGAGAGSADPTPPPSTGAVVELIQAAPNTLYDRNVWIGFMHGANGSIRALAAAGRLDDGDEARIEDALFDWCDRYDGPQEENPRERWAEVTGHEPKGGWRTLLRYAAGMGVDVSRWQSETALAVAKEQFDAIPGGPGASDVKPPPMLDRGDPMRSAREMIERNYRAQGKRTLHHHKGALYRWSGAHYQEVDDRDVTAALYTFLDGAFHVGQDKQGAEAQVPFRPNTTRVNEVRNALSAISHLDGAIRAPAWIGRSDSGDRPGADEILPCSNGLLHLPTRRLLPHTPAFFGLNALPYTFEPDAPAPAQWLAFLRSIWADDPDTIGTVQEVFGLLLTLDVRHHKAFLLVGPPRSGKGTIARVLTEMLGRENVANPTLASLGQNFGIAPLIGKPLALIADARLGGRADGHSVTERLLSISGEDGQTVDRKHREVWEGTLPTRFLIMSNELPRFVDASGALASRFVVMQMKASFLGREDQGLTVRLLKEMPGILNWALAGLDRLNVRGHFVQPASASGMIEDLQDLASPVGAFMRERCVVGPEVSVSRDDLFHSWQEWCLSEGHQAGAQSTFGRSLRAAVPGLGTSHPWVNGVRVRAYTGLGLAPDTSGTALGDLAR